MPYERSRGLLRRRSILGSSCPTAPRPKLAIGPSSSAVPWPTQIPLGVGSEAITASFGVAAADAGTLSAEELLKRAEEGRRRPPNVRAAIAWCLTTDDESNAWTNLGAPGKLFDRTLARDVMAPCTVHLREDDTAQHAGSVFERTGQSAIPPVNREGKLTV